MANLAQGDQITKADYDTFKAAIRTEYNRRKCSVGKQSWALATGYTTNPTITVGNNILRDNDADPPNLVKISQSTAVAKRVFAGTTQSGDLIQVGDSLTNLSSLYTIVNNLKGATESTSKGGCAGACVGLCVGTCYTTCANGCGSNNQINGTWIGGKDTASCSAGCSGHCINGCTKCDDTCKAGCGSGCGAGCTSTCGQNCGNGCSTGCKNGCGSNCSGNCMLSANA